MYMMTYLVLSTGIQWSEPIKLILIGLAAFVLGIALTMLIFEIVGRKKRKQINKVVTFVVNKKSGMVIPDEVDEVKEDTTELIEEEPAEEAPAEALDEAPVEAIEEIEEEIKEDNTEEITEDNNLEEGTEEVEEIVAKNEEVPENTQESSIAEEIPASVLIAAAIEEAPIDELIQEGTQDVEEPIDEPEEQAVLVEKEPFEQVTAVEEPEAATLRLNPFITEVVQTKQCGLSEGKLHKTAYLQEVVCDYDLFDAAIDNKNAREQAALSESLLCEDAAFEQEMTEESVKPFRFYGVSRTFLEKLEMANEIVQERYDDVKAFLVYYGAKPRISKSCETYRIGRKAVAKMAIRGKTLSLYLALSPNEFMETKYKFSDVSDVKRYQLVPMRTKLRSSRSVKWAKELIKTMMDKLGVVPKQKRRKSVEANVVQETQ